MTETAAKATFLTQEAYDRLKAELAELSGPARTEIAKKIDAARQEGDLRENGGYHAAREEQGKMEARIRQLEAMLRECRRVLKPNGILLYETFTIDNYFRHQHPRRWEFCLAQNELLRLTSPLRVLHYDEGEHDGGHGSGPCYTARLVAQKTGPETSP